LGAKLSRSIIPVHVLVKQHNSRGAQRFLSEVRRHNGFIEIARNQKGDGVKGILKALGKGEGIGYVLDQTRPGEERVPFFGFGAKTNTGLAALWCRKDVPIIPASIRRLDFANHEITFHEPLDLSSFNRERQDLLPLTEYFNEVLQNMILANPWQYLWVHDRWK
jgi:Kdo2-lipid IVA lauroyltransferase/acyltransferase